MEYEKDCQLSDSFMTRFSGLATGLKNDTCPELTRVRMLLARSAYASVLRDSSKATEAGLMWAIMTVRLFPPSESCQSKTSEEKTQ